MTSFTTAGGLWSFANAASAPIADLGIYGGLGVLAAMALTLTLLPAILAVLPGGHNHSLVAKTWIRLSKLLPWLIVY